jgi:hypothetical protein
VNDGIKLSSNSIAILIIIRIDRITLLSIRGLNDRGTVSPQPEFHQDKQQGIWQKPRTKSHHLHGETSSLTADTLLRSGERIKTSHRSKRLRILFWVLIIPRLA